MPNASFIGFTGTPIEKADANTRTVFGDYISTYDIARVNRVFKDKPGGSIVDSRAGRAD